MQCNFHISVDGDFSKKPDAKLLITVVQAVRSQQNAAARKVISIANLVIQSGETNGEVARTASGK